MALQAKDPWLVRSWYGKSPWLLVLLPLSLIFYLLSSLRRWLYRVGLLASFKADVPLVVVGNISVGGTGKTPLVIALVKQLQREGFTPAIISRGYGSKADQYPYFVDANSSATCSGDEPLLIAKRTAAPVVIDARRGRAIAALQARYPECDVIISDDGLQHYAMQRDVEIAVVDGKRGFGNGYLLPAGPLRETVSRLRSVDFLVTNGSTGLSLPGESFAMQLAVSAVITLDGSQSVVPTSWQLSKRVHAVAGIGNPQRFFDTLQAQGFEVIPHAFDDHHRYRIEDLQFDDELPVLMTEKDAVKVRELSLAGGEYWYLAVDAELPDAFFNQLVAGIQSAR